MRHIRRACSVIVAWAAIVVPASVVAQDFPTRPITIISAQAPGGASDLVARLLGERMQAAWGQPVVVDSRPGAGGNVGAGVAARAQPDGHTLMIGTDAMMTSNLHLYKAMPFDPVADFAPVINAGANIIGVAVSAQLPVASMPELIAYAKANPGKLQYGSSGIASPHHLAGELLAQKAAISMVHVPYRGGGFAVKDLLGGHINMALLSLSAAMPHVTAGSIRLLAVVEEQRYPGLPDVPTVGETLPGFAMSSWVGVFAPAATPKPVIAKLHGEMARTLNDASVKDKLAALGLAGAPTAPDDLAALVRSGIALRGALIKAANIAPQ